MSRIARTNVGRSMHLEARQDQDVSFSAKMMVSIYYQLREMDDLTQASKEYLLCCTEDFVKGLLKETGKADAWDLLKKDIPSKPAMKLFPKAFNFNFERGSKRKSSVIKKKAYQLIHAKRNEGKSLEEAISEVKAESNNKNKEIGMLECERLKQIYYEIHKREELFKRLDEVVKAARAAS